MTNREAINLLEEVRVLDDSIYAYNKAYSEALEMALTALEAEETWYDTHEYPPKEPWIPVTERLPNEDEIIYNCVGINGERKVSDRVCAIDSDGFIRCGYFQKSCMEHEYWGNGRKNEYSETGIASWEFGDHWECDPNQWIVTVSKSIVAWMPLPEGYKAIKKKKQNDGGVEK